ncbi:MAG TPA: hypothetical protein VMV16_09090 [Solirubrobacteraceae bacterium]|nr:hypothetical protein [Solirubrobacteraceae bacterium]
MSPRACRRLARVLCHVYPPSWRDRYSEEFVDVLSEMVLTPRTVLDVLDGALDAWANPSGLVLGGRLRLRASVSVVWGAWIVLTAGALIFGQSTEDSPFRRADATHPVAALVYGVYEWCAHLSVVAVVVAGAPLAWALLRAAYTQRRRSAIALVLLPVAAPMAFLGVLVLIAQAVPRSTVPGVGVGPAWFAVLVVLGLLAAALCAAGPALGLRRVSASPGVLRWSLRASVPALALMSVSAAASVCYELALARSDPSFAAGYGRPWWQLAPYALVMAAAGAAAMTSIRRGVRATVPVS